MKKLFIILLLPIFTKAQIIQESVVVTTSVDSPTSIVGRKLLSITPPAGIRFLRYNGDDISFRTTADLLSDINAASATHFHVIADITNFPTTTAFLTSSTNKNFVTDAQLTLLGNTSGTNSGDNAVNTLYSNDYRAANFVAGTHYLAPNGNIGSTSGINANTQSAIDGKQATLVSGTNIKTINGNTLLGSGDVVVGGGATSSTSGVAATPTASGTTTITHNLGRTPTIIRIYSISSFTSNAAATPVPFSMGTWNSTGNRCIYMVINGTTTQVSQSSSVFSIIMVTSAGNRIEGVIGNVTSTSFDIVFTETGTHTAGNFLWEAQ